MHHLRHSPDATIAKVLAILAIVVQVLIGGPAAAGLPGHDAFGVLCSAAADTPSADGTDQAPSHNPATCCAMGCGVLGAAVIPPDVVPLGVAFGRQPAMRAAEPRDGPHLPPLREPGNPRAPPITA